MKSTILGCYTEFKNQFIWPKGKMAVTLIALAFGACFLLDFSIILMIKNHASYSTIHATAETSVLSLKILLYISAFIGLAAAGLELYNKHAGLEIFLLWPLLVPLLISQVYPNLMTSSQVINDVIFIEMAALLIRTLILTILDFFTFELGRVFINPLVFIIPLAIGEIIFGLHDAFMASIKMIFLLCFIYMCGAILGFVSCFLFQIVKAVNRKVFGQ